MNICYYFLFKTISPYLFYNYIFLFFFIKSDQTQKVSEKQLSVLIASVSSYASIECVSEKQANKKFWEQTSIVLNKEGPCTKSAESWRNVCIDLKKPEFKSIFCIQYFYNYKSNIVRKIKSGAAPTPMEKMMNVLTPNNT